MLPIFRLPVMFSWQGASKKFQQVNRDKVHQIFSGILSILLSQVTDLVRFLTQGLPLFSLEHWFLTFRHETDNDCVERTEF